MIVAVYARVSTVRQAEKNLSIPDQLKQVRDWCAASGHNIAVEYVEPGASATDDNRPEFQKMIEEACRKPAPFDAIIIHSFSRFFRDAVEFGIYEKRLKKYGVRVISITQQVADDPSGMLVKGVFTLFDEYQSKENGKHTSRAMKENARQGFFNGSQPLFGYRKKEAEGGMKIRRKFVLEPDPAEAVIVREIFSLYLSNRFAGIREIAAHLNAQGKTRRGRKWIGQNVLKVLCETSYIGEHYFNKIHGKTGQVRPKEEWIKVPVEPIVDLEVYRKAEALRKQRAPNVQAPRVVNSPVLLTGLLRCGVCNSPMTLATAKSGKFKYYKCAKKLREGKGACVSAAIPLNKLDESVIDTLSEKVFQPERVKIMLEEMRKRTSEARGSHQAELVNLKYEIEKQDEKKTKLYEAVENGFIPTDESLRERFRQLENRRKELLAQMAGLRRKTELPLGKATEREIRAFCAALKDRLRSNVVFAKSYLRFLVDEIRIEGKKAVIRGSNSAVAALVTKNKEGTSEEVPSLGFFGEPSGDRTQDHLIKSLVIVDSALII